MILATALAALAASLLPLPVLAHAELVSSDPADGAVLAAPPSAITLVFDEPLADGSSFELVGPSGTVGSGAIDPAAPTQLILATPSLAPGAYQVKWRSVADDKDIERGVLGFTIASTSIPAAPTTPAETGPGASTAPTTAPGSAVASPAASGGSGDAAAGSSTGDVLLPILAALVVVGAGAIYLLRRSPRA